MIFISITSNAFAFDLSVTATGGSGNWDNGVYVINRGSTVNFLLSPTNGSSPYTYCWNLGTIEGYKNEADSSCHSTVKNPSHTFDSPGEFDVWVTVTDNDSDSEKALIKVRSNVATGTPIKVSAQPGGTSQERLQAALDAADPSGIVEIDENIVLTNTYTPYYHTYSIKINGTNVEIYSNPGITITSSITDNTHPSTFFFYAYNNYNAQNIWFHNIDATSFAPQTTNYIGFFSYRSTKLTSDRLTAQDCTLSNFQEFFSGHKKQGGYILNRINFLNWGGHDWEASPPGGSVAFFAGPNMLLRSLYLTSHEEHVNVVYAGPGKDHIYIVDSYLRGNETSKEQHRQAIKWYGNCSATATTSGDQYIRGSIFLDWGSNAVNFGVSGNLCTSYSNYEISNSYFANLSNNAISIRTGYLGLNNVTIEGNWFWDLKTAGIDEPEIFRFRPIIHHVGGELHRNFSIQNNFDGPNTNDTERVGLEWDDCEWCDGDTDGDYEGFMFLWSESDLAQQYVDDASWTVSGNTETTSRPQWAGTDIYNVNTGTKYDPGRFEYSSPTIVSGTWDSANLDINASDTGSGLGAGASNARFPFQEGAFIQVVDAANNFSEIKDYNTSTTWNMTPDKFRIGDVDHNVSGLKQAGPSAPTNLRIKQ
jgi:hypothetical protein